MAGVKDEVQWQGHDPSRIRENGIERHPGALVPGRQHPVVEKACRAIIFLSHADHQHAFLCQVEVLRIGLRRHDRPVVP